MMMRLKDPHFTSRRWANRMRWAFSALSQLTLVVTLASTTYAGATKVDVCHRPPDNPTNVQIISINENAYDTHVAHGDNAVGPEVCDGIDNDCNGLIDDGVADLVSGTDVGVCQTEIQSCQNGTFVITQAGITPGPETCDGLDNDCNGVNDNDVANLTSGTDVGECQQEIQSCVGGTFVVTQAGIAPATDVCDGLDNDCNGTTDDQVAANASCGDGVACTVDTCVSGSCTNSPDDSTCQTGESCTVSGCQPAICPCAGLALGQMTWTQDLKLDMMGNFNLRGNGGFCYIQEYEGSSAPGLPNHYIIATYNSSYLCSINSNVETPGARLIETSEAEALACRDSLNSMWLAVGGSGACQ